MQRERWADLPENTPVIVGAGVATQEGAVPPDGRDAFDLMEAATRRAADDSGSTALLSRVDVVSVPEGSWSHANAAGQVAARVGAPHARTVVVQAGIPQQTLFDDAYRAVIAGEVQVALIVGGESAGRAALATRAGLPPAEPVPWPRAPDERRAPEGEIVSPLEIEAGLWSPVQQYALIDSALRHAEHRTPAEHRDEIAELWSGFSRVASTFEHAAHPTPRTAEFLRDPGPDNRMLAFPYNKWHCSQMHVDQAAALLVTSLGAARALGVDLDRVVFPRVALESSASIAVIRRRDLHRWPAMHVLGGRAAALLGRPLDAVEHVELYSCFPAAVRVQQRELGLPLDGVPTITGGEPFAGGPWNNFVLQATAAMIDRVRADRGSLGIVTTVSGFLHKPGIAVYATDPGPGPLEVADLADEATAATRTRPIATGYRGPATIAACTVTADRSGERRLVALVDTSDDERWIAFSASPDLVDRALEEELIGETVHVDGFEIMEAPAAT
jgi:acetyl-CoA C-acetyltransferase